MTPNTFQFPNNIIDSGRFFTLSTDTQWALLQTLRHGKFPSVRECEKRMSPLEIERTEKCVEQILGGK